MDLDRHINDMEETSQTKRFSEINFGKKKRRKCIKIESSDESQDEDESNGLTELFGHKKCYDESIDQQRMNQIIKQRKYNTTYFLKYKYILIFNIKLTYCILFLENQCFWQTITTVDFEKYYLMEQPQVELVLSKCGKNLKELRLGSVCDSSILPVIKKYCHKLVTLSIEIEFRRQIDFVEFCSDMRRLKNLKFFTSFWLHNSKIDVEEFVIDSIPKKHKILSIDFSHCRFRSGIKSITNFANLKLLNIAYVDAVDDWILKILAENSVEIIDLNVEGCKRITNTGLDWLSSMKKLEKLNISFNNNITDELFIKFISLKNLSCGGCKNITNDGISNLLKNLIPSGFKYLEIYQTSVDAFLLIYAYQLIANLNPNCSLNIVASGSLFNDYYAAIEKEPCKTDNLIIQWTSLLVDYSNENFIEFSENHGKNVNVEKSPNEYEYVDIMN